MPPPYRSDRVLAVGGFVAFWTTLLVALGLPAVALALPVAVGAFVLGAIARDRCPPLLVLRPATRDLLLSTTGRARRLGRRGVVAGRIAARHGAGAAAACVGSARAAGRGAARLGRATMRDGVRILGAATREAVRLLRLAARAADRLLQVAGHETVRIGRSLGRAAESSLRLAGPRASRATVAAGGRLRAVVGELTVLGERVAAHTGVLAHRHLAQARAAPAPAPAPNDAWKLNRAASDLRREGRLEEAIACCEQALTVVADASDPREEALTLNNLGLALARAGDAERAGECFGRAVAILRELESRHLEGQVLANLGTLREREERREEALACWREALDLLEEGSRERERLVDRVEATSVP